MGQDAMILVFWMLSFKSTYSLSFTFIKRLFSSSSLSAIRVVSSAYLRLLIFLPAILIPACASSSPVFLLMYSADNHDGVITHLEPDILECEVKWALESITMNKASGGGNLAELFQILTDAAMKGLHSICQQIWKTQQWPQDRKRSVFFPIPKKRQSQRMLELPHNCTHFTH